MDDKPSIQKIADDLGMSRNTVSKVINNRPVPESTKTKVINKAIELGYKGFKQLKDQMEGKHLKLLLLSGKPLSNLDFFISLIRGVENLVSEHNIDFFQYTVNKNKTFDQLKMYINSLSIDGIIGIELYDETLLNNVLLLNIPIVLIDGMKSAIKQKGFYDTILMNNREPIREICTKFIKSGIYRISFCGDIRHCLGFYERYLGVRDAFADVYHRMDLKNSILLPDDSPYGNTEWLANQIMKLPVKPQVFICANDFIAITLIASIKKLGYRIPEDMQVVGFDNTMDASLVTPTLTTVNVNKEILGHEALHILIDRINRPLAPNRIIYIPTNIVYRSSTSI